MSWSNLQIRRRFRVRKKKMISFNMSWLNLSMRKEGIFRKGRLALGEKRGGGIGGFGGNETEGLRDWRKGGR